MLRTTTLPILLLASAMLSACGGSAEDSKTTETRMDDIDSIEGTISDDSINTDESTEEGMIDPEAPAATGKAKAAAEKTDAGTAKTEAGAAPADAKTESDPQPATDNAK